MKHAAAICLLLLGLVGCSSPPREAIDVSCDSARAMQAQLQQRLPRLQEIETAVEPDGLWRELPPPERVAIIGFDVEPGLWRIPPDALTGGPMAGIEPVTARARLEHFLEHARWTPEAQHATGADLPKVIAAHATRALATELIGKYKTPIVFARYDARAPGLEIFVADAIRDSVLLAGPHATTLIWLRDGERRVTLAIGVRKRGSPPKLSQTEIVGLLNGK